MEPEDVKKLYSSFDLNSPTGLLEKVWFDMDKSTFLLVVMQPGNNSRTNVQVRLTKFGTKLCPASINF